MANPTPAERERLRTLCDEIIFWIETSTEADPNSIRLDTEGLTTLKLLPLVFTALDRVEEERDDLLLARKGYRADRASLAADRDRLTAQMQALTEDRDTWRAKAKALNERAEWWRTDIRYKAPEQLTIEYLATILDDLGECILGLEDSPSKET